MSRYPKQDQSPAMKRLEELNGAAVEKPLILNDQSIEPVVNIEMGNGFNDEIEFEKFMNEIVEVTIMSSGAPNEEPSVIFNVNGRNQAFFRDVPTPCRRMILEVIARCKKTNYKQRLNAYGMPDPDQVQLDQTTVFAYPFTVIDTNPKGRAWLQAVKAEAN